MIDAFKALRWLNAIDKTSHLNNEDHRRIREIGKLGLFDFRIERILERLREAAHVPGDPLRNAEILLYCAAIGHSLGELPQAARDAGEAVILYDNDNHRCAVARWIWGIMQWEMLLHQDAHRNWAEAKRLFQRCEGDTQGSVNGDNWYGEPIWQMEVELVARPDEISTWLNRYEPSSLRPPTRQIIDRVRDKTREKAYPSLYVLIQDLQEAVRRSEKMFERGEIYLEFGLAMYNMGNSYFAMELLRKSVRAFHTGVGTDHKQVVARGMLGALEWMHELSSNQAAADWLLCIDEFERLQFWAERDHFSKRAEWYLQRCNILRSALLERVKPSGKSNPGEKNPTGDSSMSASSPPKWGKSDPYDELLSKVGWDRAMADRLVESERKRAPTADRNELIRRAIEGWIRDDQ